MTPDIFENSYRLLNKYNQKTQKPKHYGTDDLLYAAEVHMIDTIGTHGENKRCCIADYRQTA